MKTLAVNAKFKQDLSYLTACVNNAQPLTGHYIYNRWLPDFLQDIVEQLFLTKPIKMDIGCLLGLIMFGGINVEKPIQL
jgi:hypothetical protein